MRWIVVTAMLAACGPTMDEGSPATGDVAISITAPSSVVRGSNTFVVHIDHPHASSVEASAWMPAMGHGAPSEPRVIKVDDSTYRVEDVVFSMAGAWDVRVNVTCPHGNATRRFRYEVP